MNDDVVTSIETSAMTLAWIPDIIAGLVLVLQAPLGPCARVFDPSPKSLKWTALPRSRGSTRRSRGRGAREVGGVPGEAGGGGPREVGGVPGEAGGGGPREGGGVPGEAGGGGSPPRGSTRRSRGRGVAIQESTPHELWK